MTEFWGLMYSLKVKVKVSQLSLTFCDPMDYTVRGILQARILEWAAVPFSRGSSQPKGSNPGLSHCRRILYQLSYWLWCLEKVTWISLDLTFLIYKLQWSLPASLIYKLMKHWTFFILCETHVPQHENGLDHLLFPEMWRGYCISWQQFTSGLWSARIND